mgnify:CR=1 FL=1
MTKENTQQPTTNPNPTHMNPTHMWSHTTYEKPAVNLYCKNIGPELPTADRDTRNGYLVFKQPNGTSVKLNDYNYGGYHFLNVPNEGTCRTWARDNEAKAFAVNADAGYGKKCILYGKCTATGERNMWGYMFHHRMPKDKSGNVFYGAPVPSRYR